MSAQPSTSTVSAPAATRPVYGMVAEFSSAAALYHAAEKARDFGFKRWDVFSPFPIHGMDKAMGLGRSVLSKFIFLGGLTGLLTAFFLQAFTSFELYPLVVHGKPKDLGTLPAFFPVMFELTILFSAFTAVLGMLGLNRLPRLHHPLFNHSRFARVTNDGFFLAVEATDPKFSEARGFLESAGGQHISIVEDVD